MIRNICLFLILCFSCGSTVMGQALLSKEVRRNVRHGNRMFHSGQRDQATVSYMKAFQADSTSSLVQYNLATSLFPNEWKLLSGGQRDTVIARLASAAQAEQNPIRRSMSYHNIGVAMQSAGQLQQAIEAYKQCLRCNPADDEARYNMVLCQRQLKDQPQDGGGG
ncbi:MAG: tetratricopeptide repeat protein, partial [Prevotella sp.]|nr:tetratricopeptide repeat protein [Prevotella sp.]